jgi:hypothetical protein
MGVCWFASDRDGHVALFVTGESGAVPHAALSYGDPSALLNQLTDVLPTGKVIYDLSGRVVPGKGPDAQHRLLEGEGDLKSVLMFLKSYEHEKLGLPENAGKVFPAIGGVAVAFETLPREIAEALHKSRRCLGCFWNPKKGVRSFAIRLGMFEYEHLTDSWLAGPYGRHRLPEKPMRIDDLPEPLRRKVEGMRFGDLCFAEAPFIQPIDHSDCETDGSAYLGLDGKTVRAIPGKEDEYIEQLADLGRHPDLIVHRPGGSKLKVLCWIIFILAALAGLGYALYHFFPDLFR